MYRNGCSYTEMVVVVLKYFVVVLKGDYGNLIQYLNEWTTRMMLEIRCLQYAARNTLFKISCSKYIARIILLEIHCPNYIARNTLPELYCSKYIGRNTLLEIHCSKITERKLIPLAASILLETKQRNIQWPSYKLKLSLFLRGLCEKPSLCEKGTSCKKTVSQKSPNNNLRKKTTANA